MDQFCYNAIFLFTRRDSGLLEQFDIPEPLKRGELARCSLRDHRIPLKHFRVNGG